MESATVTLTDEARNALRDRLTQSSFMRMLGGAGFGGISWLLAVGLLTVVLGSTWNQAEPSKPLVNTPMVVGGWVYVLASVVLAAVYLRQVIRFFHDVRVWTEAEVRHRTEVFTPPSPLETKLSALSVQQGAGPGVTWAYGAVLMPPCGLVMAPISLVVLAIMVSDWRSGQITLSALDRAEMVAAALAALFVTSIFVVVAAGFQKAGRRFQRLGAGG